MKYAGVQKSLIHIYNCGKTIIKLCMDNFTWFELEVSTVDVLKVCKVHEISTETCLLSLFTQ